MLTTSSGKHLKEISHAQIVSLKYKLTTSSRYSDDLSIGCDRDRGRGQRELNTIKKINGKSHVRIYLKDNFGFVKQQKKATYGLGYKLPLTRTVDNAV